MRALQKKTTFTACLVLISLGACIPQDTNRGPETKSEPSSKQNTSGDPPEKAQEPTEPDKPKIVFTDDSALKYTTMNTDPVLILEGTEPRIVDECSYLNSHHILIARVVEEPVYQTRCSQVQPLPWNEYFRVKLTDITMVHGPALEGDLDVTLMVKLSNGIAPAKGSYVLTGLRNEGHDLVVFGMIYVGTDQQALTPEYPSHTSHIVFDLPSTLAELKQDMARVFLSPNKLCDPTILEYLTDEALHQLINSFKPGHDDPPCNSTGPWDEPEDESMGDSDAKGGG